MEPVNLTNLRSMTDGDREMEKILFEEFLSSFAAGIASLQAHTDEKDAEAWRKETHALKGMALNLGAMELGALCQKAQEEPHAGAKSEWLKKTQAEFARVREFLSGMMVSGK